MLKVLCAIDRTLSGDRSHNMKLPMPFYMMRSIASYGRSIAPRHFYDRCLQLSAPKCGIYPLHFCSLRSIASSHAIDRASGILLSVSFLGKLRSIAPYRAIDLIVQFFYAFIVRSIAPSGRSIAYCFCCIKTENFVSFQNFPI